MRGLTAQAVHRRHQVIPIHDLPSPGETQPRMLRAVRLVMRIARVRNRAVALSWLAWLLCIAGFAVWTSYHYQAPAGVPWIGMTIRTSIFAIWLLVAREWLLIQLQRRQSRLSHHQHDSHD
jgi:hypothetical protein